MEWEQAISEVSSHIVKIETPSGFGTGFLAFYNHDHTWCAIATAAHVVSHADEWQQPIRVRHQNSSAPKFLTANDRVIFIDHRTDSAVVLFLKSDLQLPEIPVTLFPAGEPVGIGVSVGWLGFPVIEPFSLCFFAGTVSARLDARKAYLIDGVAINGVSGGPVIHCRRSDTVEFIGCISSYHANRATGETLPGLLVAQDVAHFHTVMSSIRSLEEANARKREFEKEHQSEEGTTSQDVASAEGSGEPEPPPTPAPE